MLRIIRGQLGAFPDSETSFDCAQDEETLKHPYSSPVTLPRPALISPRCFFLSIRRCTARRPGRVGMRRLGGSTAFRIISASRLRASSRLSACERDPRASTIISPSLVNLDRQSRMNRFFTAGGKLEAVTFQRNCTAVDTLFTF